MKNSNAFLTRVTSRVSLAACAPALAAAVAVALPQPAYAGNIKVPPVPSAVQVKTGNEVFFVGHGVGTQNYVCVPSGSGVAFVLFTPEATLFNDDGKQLTRNFFSPNPQEHNTTPAVFAAGTIRATWQYSNDSSTVWGKVNPGESSSDAHFVAPNAIAWLLVTVLHAENGPTGGDALSQTSFIQRLNTSGGLAPSQGCTSSADLGNSAFVPYTADYFFYRHVRPETDQTTGS